MAQPLFDTVHFKADLGFFYRLWTVSDALMDFSLGQFLRLTDDETHIVTSGMPFGRKTALLRSLVARSKHKDKGKIKKLINSIQNESLRNVFAHSYIASDDKVISFVERSHSSDYWAKEHRFTMHEFNEHVTQFAYNLKELGDALEIDEDRFRMFQAAAFNVPNKAGTAPTPPS